METKGRNLEFVALSPEEDTRRFRDFMQSVQFRNASNAIRLVETESGGLTPAEVWSEVEKLIVYLRTMKSDDRVYIVGQLVTNLRRSLKKIVRDGDAVHRDVSDVNRTVTCVLYCLALRLESTSKDVSKNPHSNLINALVDELHVINHSSLPLIYYLIKYYGTANEKRGLAVEENDPMPMEENWREQLGRVVSHYCARADAKIDRGKYDAFCRFWEYVVQDETLASQLMTGCSIKGGEWAELGVDYNCKMFFNIYGLLFDHGFFVGISGWGPLGKALTEHYDEVKGKKVFAKSDYFNYQRSNGNPSIVCLTEDTYKSVIKYINLSMQR